MQTTQSLSNQMDKSRGNMSIVACVDKHRHLSLYMNTKTAIKSSFFLFFLRKIWLEKEIGRL